MKYAAVRLSDGSLRSEIYDSIEDARKDVANDPSEYAFVAYRNYMTGLSKEHAQIFLSVHRMMPKSVRQGDPDKGRSELIVGNDAGDRLLAMQRLGVLRNAIGRMNLCLPAWITSPTVVR